MPKYQIGGIGVDFPYDAYDCQLKFMEQAIAAMEKAN
jgi:hypothetical protein